MVNECGTKSEKIRMENGLNTIARGFKRLKLHPILTLFGLEGGGGGKMVPLGFLLNISETVQPIFTKLCDF